MTEEVHVEGWKGKDEIEIREEEGTVIIIEHRKDKKTGEVKDQSTEIKREYIDNMKQILLSLEQQLPVKAQFMWKKIIERYNLKYDEPRFLFADRKKYMNLYYYPVKYWESKGLIHYGGRGDITLI